MADGVNSEGEINSNQNKWASLKEFGKKVVGKWKRQNPSHEIQSTPTVAEISTIPEGYQELIESYKLNPEQNSPYIVQLLEKQYPNLISEIENENLSKEVRQMLLNNINNGDQDVVAVIMRRFLDRSNKNSRIAKVITGPEILAREMEKHFVQKEVARDQFHATERVKISWAEAKFREAVQNPRWIPQPVSALAADQIITDKPQ